MKRSPSSARRRPRTRLEFSIGTWGGFQFEAELLSSGKLRISTGDILPGEPRTIEIPDDRWQTFWHEVESIGVLHWKGFYSREVCDGTCWDLTLVHKGRKLRSHGLNAYPESEGPDGDINYPLGGQFDRFLKALTSLTGIPLPLDQE